MASQLVPRASILATGSQLAVLLLVPVSLLLADCVPSELLSAYSSQVDAACFNGFLRIPATFLGISFSLKHRPEVPFSQICNFYKLAPSSPLSRL